MSDNTQNEDLIPMNITIADRSYRVKISAKDEEAVRKTAALINQKMVEFKNAYAGKDQQDYISMVLLWFTTEQQKTGSNLYEIETAQKQIDTLTNWVDKALSDSKITPNRLHSFHYLIIYVAEPLTHYRKSKYVIL